MAVRQSVGIALTLAAGIAIGHAVSPSAQGVTTVQAQQSSTYVKGDTVRLAVQPPADALPDSTVIAVPGDRVQTRKAEILVNGQSVTLSDTQRQQFVAETDEIVPERHYVVVGERRDGPYSVVTYYGLIPATKIVQKLN